LCSTELIYRRLIGVDLFPYQDLCLEIVTTARLNISIDNRSCKHIDRTNRPPPSSGFLPTDRSHRFSRPAVARKPPNRPFRN
jgi:hypothetical protein